MNLPGTRHQLIKNVGKINNSKDLFSSFSTSSKAAESTMEVKVNIFCWKVNKSFFSSTQMWDQVGMVRDLTFGSFLKEESNSDKSLKNWGRTDRKKDERKSNGNKCRERQKQMSTSSIDGNFLEDRYTE